MSSTTERLTAALSDRYRIERELGAGGMATVYLAEDLKHDRKVAIKVLKPELAAVLGADRFVQEIKTTAALSHPHILPLFDSGEAGGFLYYVMPWVRGETIREKLNRETQFGVDEAVRIAREVADALDYAHRNGVIHRDIKPENILLHDGRPMVMDFGIALAVSAAAGGRMTETGLSLGTPHYMSPEQATADKDITARSDVYSLASVLYEMLAGVPPHEGGSAQQTIMRIITDTPRPVTELRKSVPANVAAALDKAMEKLPADRFDSAKAFADALANPLFALPASAAMAGARDRRWRRLALGLAAALVIVAAVAALAWIRPAPAAPASRFAVSLPVATALVTLQGSTMAVSADGRVLAFVGADSTGVSRIWVKRAGEIEAAPVPGTDNGMSPFLSPDGLSLGFFHGNPISVRVVALAGGSPRVITGPPLSASGAFWATDGFIYFDASTAGIDRVRPDGTGRSNVAALDTTRQEAGYAWPEVLPGNTVLVARLRRTTDPLEDYDIVAIPLGGGRPVPLTKGVLARHLGGHLVVARADGILEARRLTKGGLALESASVTVASGVRVQEPFGMADVATDDRGALHFVTAAAAGGGSRLEWLRTGGGRTPADSARPMEGSGTTAILPPSGGRRTLIQAGARAWLKELPSGVMLPVEFPGGLPTGVGWGYDGDSLLLALPAAGGGTEIWRRRPDGLGDAAVIARDTGMVGGVIASTHDMRWLVAQRLDAGAPGDLVVFDRQQDSGFRTLIPSAPGLFLPRLSPDGRWVAYVSARSGRSEVYVQPFPDVNGGIWPVSVDGGNDPQWSPRGDRLFFRRPDAILSVDITTSPTFHPSPPRVMFRTAELAGLDPDAGYAVGPEGDRLLMLARISAYSSAQLVRVENAISEVRGGRQR